MNTFVFPNDTIVFKAHNVADTVSTSISTATNSYDVEIAKIVSTAIVAVVLIVALTCLMWCIIKKWSEKHKYSRELKEEYQKKALSYIKEQTEKGTYTDDDKYIGKIIEFIK